MWLIDYFHYLMQQHQLQEYLHKKGISILLSRFINEN